MACRLASVALVAAAALADVAGAHSLAYYALVAAVPVAAVAAVVTGLLICLVTVLLGTAVGDGHGGLIRLGFDDNARLPVKRRDEITALASELGHEGTIRREIH